MKPRVLLIGLCIGMMHASCGSVTKVKNTTVEEVNTETTSSLLTTHQSTTTTQSNIQDYIKSNIQNQLISYEGSATDTLTVIQTFADGSFTQTKISGKGRAQLYSTTEEIQAQTLGNQETKSASVTEQNAEEKTKTKTEIVQNSKSVQKSYWSWWWLLLLLIIPLYYFKRIIKIFDV